MDEIVEQVLSLCPGCDPYEVKRDLNTTGDIEMTINHALDGLLSPKANPVTIVMDDDDVMMSSPKFTNIKERSRDEANTSSFDNSSEQTSKYKTTTEPNSQTATKNRHKIYLDLPNSDPEGIDVSETCRKTLERLKSSVIYLETSTSKTSKNACNVESVPSSPDSDSELLKPAFDYGCTQRASTSSGAKRAKPVNMAEAVVSRGTDSCTAVSTSVNHGVNGGGFKESLKGINEDVALQEPEKKRKRTKEEIEERKREALLKKAAKEKERLEKLAEKKRQKDARAAAMLEKKLQKEKDQLQRKAERLTKSANKLDGCIKFITAYLDPTVFSEEAPDPNTNIILQKLISMEANYVIASQPYPGTISWQRTSVQHSVEESELKIMTSDCRKEENEVLIVLSAERFAEMIFSFKQGYVGGHDSLSERPETLVDFTKYVKNIYRGKKVTFLISELEKYIRDVKLKQRRAFRNAAVDEPAVEDGTRKRRKKKTLPVLDVTRTDIEEALVDLQIKTDVCVYQCETDEDIAMKIAVFTKAIAEKPYKKCLTDGHGFCLDRLDKASLKVSKDGQGMVNVWQQQIQQFRNVSREMAAAIVAEYPSPQLLKQSYEQCQSVQDAMLLLEDILVRRGGGSLATCRRIGPELSKRFYILFHSKENTNLVKG